MAKLPALRTSPPVQFHTGGFKNLSRVKKQALCGTCFALVLILPLLVVAADRAQSAREFKRQLVEKIMPYWYDTTVDQQHGGYLLSDDAAKPAPPATESSL